VVNRTHTKIALDTKKVKLKIDQVVNKRFMAEDFDKEVSAARSKGAALTRAYYGAAVEGVGKILESPRMTNIAGGNGSRITQIELKQRPSWLPAESGVLLPGSWKPLTERYIQQPPQSTTFWRKTGILAHIYNNEVARDKRLQELKNYARGNRITLRPTKVGGAPARIGTFNLLLPGLPTPVSRFLRDSFAFGRLFKDHPRYDRDDPTLEYSLWRIQWPEYTRPWLSLFASIVGKRFRQALKLHLK
jgi:hypothetical protein